MQIWILCVIVWWDWFLSCTLMLPSCEACIGLPTTATACLSTTTTTTQGKGLTRRMEGGRATVMSYPLLLLSLPHLWNQARSRGWALLQGGELTEGGTCPGPLPRHCQWRASLLRRRIRLYQTLVCLFLDVTIWSIVWEDYLMSPSLLLVVLHLLERKSNGLRGGEHLP